MRFLILLLGAVTPVVAATVNVASPPTRVNFDTAYAAASAGDTVLFPANDSATWSTSATIGKALTINGNGTTLTAGATLADGFFYVTGFMSSALVRITGFTLDAVSLATNRHCLKVADSISLTQLRIDHNTFHHGDVQMYVSGSIGVVDHNYFYNGMTPVFFSGGSRAQADASWVSMAAGTSNALFFETNQFIYNASWLGPNQNSLCFDTENGGKIVIRYNTFTATAVPVSWTASLGVIETHGNAAAGEPFGYWEASALTRRGQPVVEIYNNAINAYRADFLCTLRGSANLVHDNTLDTTQFNPRAVMYEEEQYETQFDPLRTAWPAEDQVHNSFFWNNTLRLNGVTNASYVEVSASSVGYIQQDRDYFLHAPQSSGGSESFTGANGASSTYPTNGVVYPTLGTMTFSASGANAYYPYTPYQYPHPLVTATTGLSGTASLSGNASIK